MCGRRGRLEAFAAAVSPSALGMRGLPVVAVLAARPFCCSPPTMAVEGRAALAAEFKPLSCRSLSGED